MKQDLSVVVKMKGVAVGLLRLSDLFDEVGKLSNHQRTSEPSTDAASVLPTEYIMPKILLVDDEEEFRSLLARRLELRGYEIESLEATRSGQGCPRIPTSTSVVLIGGIPPGHKRRTGLKEIKEFGNCR